MKHRALLPALALALALTACHKAPGMPFVTGKIQASGLKALSAPKDMGRFLTASLKHADRDRSGGLSAEEASLTPAQFDKLDRDQDGQVTPAEFFHPVPDALIEAQAPLFAPQIQATFDLLDRDGNGRVAPQELPSGMRGLSATAIAREDFTAVYLQMGDAATDGLFGKIGQALMGGYLWVTGQIAAEKALHPARSKPEYTPAKYGYAYEDLNLTTVDGVKISGWYLPAARPTTKTVVLTHGYQCNRTLWFYQKVVPMLQDTYNLVMIDLRNHGDSGGSVTSFSYYETYDVMAAIAYAKARGATSIGVVGQSLGAASSINAVARSPEVKALVADCAFATVLSAFQGAISSTWVPQPAVIAAAALGYASEKLGADMTTRQPITELNKIAPRPLLVIHGEDDPYIFANNAQILHGSYVGPKGLWICPGALHGDSDTTDPATWRFKVRSLLDRTL